MIRFSRDWVEDVITIPEDSLLIFGRRDAQIARNWSKAKPGRDIFDDNELTAA